MSAVEQVVTAAEPAAEQSSGTEPSLHVMGVVPDVVPAIWPHILPLIEAARSAVPEGVSRRELAEDIREKAEGGFYQVWTIYDGAELAAVAVSEIIQYSRVRVLTIQYLGGRQVDAWLGAWVEETREFARHHECEQIECRGRSGWGRKLAPYGVDLAGAAYVMEVD